VVILVRKSKKGIRSEEIRKALKLDVREVPRVFKEGLTKKKLKSKGQKRATTYFVA
jgi:Fic family protein